MPTNAAFDLANEAAWAGLRPEMNRDAALAHLQKAGVPYSELDNDGLWLLTEGDWDIEMRFSADSTHRLQQVVWGADELHWKGAAVTNVRLAEALKNLEGESDVAAWSPDDAAEDPMDGSGTAQSRPVSDEELLAAGTLWLPERGLGLVMCEGSVSQIAWRRREDLPALDAGPLTPDQIALSKKDDLESLLAKRWLSQASPLASSTKWTPLQWLLTLALIGSLGFIAKQGFTEMMLWQNAAVLTGHLVKIEPRPVKQGGDAFHIVYNDPQSRTREVVLEHADFYVPPREPGDEVQLNYVEGNPPRVKGLPRARDAAFIEYFPWGVGVVAAYTVMMALAGWLPRFLAKLNATTAGTAGTPGKPAPAPFPVATKSVRSGPPGRPPGGPDVKSF